MMTGAERQRRYRERHPDRARQINRKWWAENSADQLAKRRDYNITRHREYNVTRAHGMSRSARDWLYAEQSGRCAGCWTPYLNEALYVDHDHACCPKQRSCGACIRGLVCNGCNIQNMLAGAPRIVFPAEVTA